MKKRFENVTLVVISFKSNQNIKNLLTKIKDCINIILIENSTDLTLKDYYSKNNNIKFFFKKNIGFGPAINEAAKFIKTKYFFVLNPDLSKIEEKTIFYFLKYAKKLNDNFGVLGPRYNNLENDKSLKQSNKAKDIVNVNCISGAAMFFNRNSFEEINGFDKNIFLYFEENDICKRLNSINKKVYQVNSIKINHNRGNSFDSNNVNEIEIMKMNSIWHFAWSKFYYLKKHYTYLIAILFVLPSIIRSFLKICYYYSTKNKKDLKKYKFRFSGFVNSIMLKKSYRRPDL